MSEETMLTKLFNYVERIDETSKKTLEQATKTNGRVTNLETVIANHSKMFDQVKETTNALYEITSKLNGEIARREDEWNKREIAIDSIIADKKNNAKHLSDLYWNVAGWAIIAIIGFACIGLLIYVKNINLAKLF